MGQFNLIYASNLDDTISILWHIPEDLHYFKTLTTPIEGKKSYLIMGNNTYKTLPTKLPKREYLVLSHNSLSFERVIGSLKLNDPNIDYWVIGGKQIYELFEDLVDNIYHSVIGTTDKDYEVQENLVKYRHNEKYFEKIVSITTKGYDKNLQKEVKIINNVYKRNNKIKLTNLSEDQYRKILLKCLDSKIRPTRNALTYAYFGEQIRFNLQEGFPLLTTKKMFFRGIVEELLWFLRGATNSKELEEKGINIWKGNSSKEFLTSLKLDYEEGDIGPMYGFQWRHFNASYQGIKGTYQDKGIDQLDKVLKEIMERPTSRRMIMTTFNPLQVDEGVLYPCHSLIIQFYVEENEISLQMYQRSADVFLGLPFNIASMSLLLIIVCDYLSKKTGKEYKAKDMIISLGDIHLYEVHKEQALRQLRRRPLKMANVKIKEGKREKIEDYRYEDFILEDYNSWEGIKAEMIV